MFSDPGGMDTYDNIFNAFVLGRYLQIVIDSTSCFEYFRGETDTKRVGIKTRNGMDAEAAILDVLYVPVTTF